MICLDWKYYQRYSLTFEKAKICIIIIWAEVLEYPRVIFIDCMNNVTSLLNIKVMLTASHLLNNKMHRLEVQPRLYSIRLCICKANRYHSDQKSLPSPHLMGVLISDDFLSTSKQFESLWKWIWVIHHTSRLNHVTGQEIYIYSIVEPAH